MKPKHKYFRNQRYKQSLETKYNTNYNKYCNSNSIIFKTNELATNIQPNYDYRTGEDITAFVRWDRNKGGYIYYERPDVPYTLIHKHYTYIRKKYYKKYAAKSFRKNNNKILISSNRSLYKKVNNIRNKIW